MVGWKYKEQNNCTVRISSCDIKRYHVVQEGTVKYLGAIKLYPRN